VALQICGSAIEDPMAIWRLYAQKYRLTITDYDLADRGDPGVLTPDQAWRSRIINSRLTYAERDEIIRRSDRAPWAAVPAIADLADADPIASDGLFADAARLYWTFTWPDRINRVAVAKVHKIAHFKRPGLYMILDDRIKNLYRPCALTWLNSLSYMGRQRVKIRASLTRSREPVHHNHQRSRNRRRGRPKNAPENRRSGWLVAGAFRFRAC
jgi:hypothetical protein